VFDFEGDCNLAYLVDNVLGYRQPVELRRVTSDEDAPSLGVGSGVIPSEAGAEYDW
jgi:hypothetical protein